jgi:hypothetical protein
MKFMFNTSNKDAHINIKNKDNLRNLTNKKRNIFKIFLLN